jgi:membrane-associated phospholipid phosphatase
MTASKRAMIWAGAGALAVVVSILLVDRGLATWSHDVLHRPAWAVMLTLLGSVQVTEGGAALVFVVAAAWWAAGRPFGEGWRTAFAAAIATFLAVLLADVTKGVFGRTWPETWVHNNPSWISNHLSGFHPFKGGQAYGSFPSGHTARITAPFAVLWHRVPRLRAAWAVPTVLVTVGMIGADYHFLGDCLGGAYLAAACAATVLWFVPSGAANEIAPDGTEQLPGSEHP